MEAGLVYQSCACGKVGHNKHSQLGAMGVVELKTKKPRRMPRL
jgi:hypothetical protein